VIAWFGRSHEMWMQALGRLDEEHLDQPHPLHWMQTAPLYDIVVMLASHHLYHAGELNHLLAIYRGEAWEEGEEVEENRIATLGQRVRPPAQGGRLSGPWARQCFRWRIRNVP